MPVREIRIDLNQAFDLILKTFDSTTCIKVAEIVGSYRDAEIYEYMNHCADTEKLSVDEARRRLVALSDFRDNYCGDKPK